MIQLPQFSRSLLHPRYWLTWCGIVLLYLVVQLPYSMLCRLGRGLGHLARVVLKRRVSVARRNLELCFPELTATQRETLLKNNFESVGMGLLETGIAWFWPNKRIKKWFRYSGIEHLHQLMDDNRGILLVGVHFLTLELGARAIGQLHPGIGVYRPNNNPLLDWLQTRGRMRSNKGMLDRNDLKGMIRALKNADMIWYAPDHDYGPKASIFAPFFAVPEAASTKGSYMLIKSCKPAVLLFIPQRLPNNQGYQLSFFPDASALIPSTDEVATATEMNKLVEQAIRVAPEQYMWLHRRFKTRPPGAASLYD
jgi:Kdo2-lipid IVA lauroyltransferase/acyltransferase